MAKQGAKEAQVAGEQKSRPQQSKNGRNGSSQQNPVDSISQRHKDASPCYHVSSPEPLAYNLQPNLDSGLPVNLREHQHKYNVQQINSAPAILNATAKKITFAQGEIPIGIEPTMSPMADMEEGC